jgi:two-component system sensor histidine kinase PilS (NtrC family)
VFQARPSSPSATFWRSLQTLNVSRVAVALVLLAYFGFLNSKDFWSEEQLISRETCGLYLLLAVGFVILKVAYTQRFMSQLVLGTVVDIVVIAILFAVSNGERNGLSILFLFPLAGAAILAPMLWALFFSAVVALFLLGMAVFRIFFLDQGASISQAGLFGASYFAVVYVVNRLAHGLIKQEELAAQRGKALAIQQAINRLVIADMGDGVLVLDHVGRIFEINPAAERMLGGILQAYPVDTRLKKIPALRPIYLALKAWYAKSSISQWLLDHKAAIVQLRPYEDLQQNSIMTGSGKGKDFTAHLKLRFATIEDPDLQTANNKRSAYTVIFMQDVSQIENQAQQLKLASMGRLTASIAHEVRNPLSSISYATALLTEDISNPAQNQRLLKIVADNVTRLNQLIEDILKLSRRAQPEPEPQALSPLLQEILSEFIETRNLSPELILLDVNGDFEVKFDTMHLREVMNNLLSNAIRYASGNPGCIRVFFGHSSLQRKELHIMDDGPGINPEVRSHLFEPFFTTSNKGTGLGLYMARELCLNNHALLDYEYRSTDSGDMQTHGRFVINFSVPDLMS